jgi:hypothetical protein
MDIEYAIDAVSENALAYTTLPDELKENRDVVMATVITRGFMLKHVGHFKDDQIVVMAALSNHGDFSEASQRLQKDPTMIQFAIEHGHVPTREQAVIVEREQSSMALHKSDAAIAPFHQVERGVRANLNKRYDAHKEKRPYHQHSTVGILNDQGPNISKKLLYEINSFGLGIAPPLDRAPFPAKDPRGGTRRKRNKRTKKR